MKAVDAGQPVTLSDDPPLRRSGGHFSVGTSKAPRRAARERSRVVINVVCALEGADSENIPVSVGVNSASPISNGVTTVAEDTKASLYIKN